MPLEKPSFHTFSEAIKGCHIKRGEVIIPRFAIYHSLAPDSLFAIMEKRHPFYTTENKTGWRDGRLIVDVYTGMRSEI